MLSFCLASRTNRVCRRVVPGDLAGSVRPRPHPRLLSSPSRPAAVRRRRPTDARVGDLLYSLLSAVDNVTWFGLFSAFDASAAGRPERAGTATVPITVDGAGRLLR